MRPGLFCPFGLQSKGVPLRRGGLERRKESAAQAGWLGGGKCLLLAPHSPESDSRGETHTSQVSPSPWAPKWRFSTGHFWEGSSALGPLQWPRGGGGGVEAPGIGSGGWRMVLGPATWGSGTFSRKSRGGQARLGRATGPNSCLFTITHQQVGWRGGSQLGWAEAAATLRLQSCAAGAGVRILHIYPPSPPPPHTLTCWGSIPRRAPSEPSAAVLKGLPCAGCFSPAPPECRDPQAAPPLPSQPRCKLEFCLRC